MLSALVLVLLAILLIGVLSMAATPPLLPFDSTADLFVLDGGLDRPGEDRVGCECILRITPAGVVTIEVAETNILAITGEADVDFNDEDGMAIDALGDIYFVERESDAILKKVPGGALTALTTEEDIIAATGGTGNVEGIAFSDDGFLYVNEESSDSVLRVDPTTGAVSVYVSKATLEALGSGRNVNLHGPIVGADGGVVYTASDAWPSDRYEYNTIFRIAPGGIPTILVEGLSDGSRFKDLDVFMTRAPNGDLIIGDDVAADTFHRVTPAGVVSTFLSEDELEDCVGMDVELEGGIVFDDAGNFYIAETRTGSIYKFDPALQCSLFVSAADIQEVTGIEPYFEGGIAFAPTFGYPDPVGGIVVPVSKLGLVAPWMGLAALAVVAVAAVVVRRRQSA
jgi:sugar lactone lactonase YvrE